MKRITALILDDSLICRQQLRSTLECEGDIEIVGEAPSGEGVLDLISDKRPQVLVVDLQMPRAGGHETIERVMAHQPLPILVVTSQPVGPSRELVFEAIRKGALDLAEKPALFDHDAQARLRATVRRLATVPVVRHVAGKLRTDRASLVRSSQAPPPMGGVPIVGIGSSAGGPVVLASILGSWSSEFPAAVLVVQHLPPNFMAGFVDFLRTRTRLNIVGVEGQCRLEPGSVYLPVKEEHLGLVGGELVGPVASPPVNGHLPAVEVLFESMAHNAPSRSLGVVLSGIGRDGTGGALALRRKGGRCVAQDEASSAVWGMPRSALEAGAAEKALSPQGISAFALDWALSQGAR